MIPFNLPCITGKEFGFMQQAMAAGHLAGNGQFSHRCQSVVKEKFGFTNAFFTPSGTAALEMAAMLCHFEPGDEVILPSYTHVSTANAFIRAGAVVRFGDSLPDHPNLDPESAKKLIGPKTKAIVIVHYGGTDCDALRFRRLANERRLFLIEDAAHAIGARCGGQWLGTQGDFAAFSFHETKNINCGHGGLLVVNRPELTAQALEIWQHGTNRASFEKKEVPLYTWTRPGGAFQLPELNAAFLYPQLTGLNEINARRMERWQQYDRALRPFEKEGFFRLPVIPEEARHNAHIFYLLMASEALRSSLIACLQEKGILAVFHYAPLHLSPYAVSLYGESCLPHATRFGFQLLRLPLYDSLTSEMVNKICDAISEWINSQQHT